MNFPLKAGGGKANGRRAKKPRPLRSATGKTRMAHVSPSIESEGLLGYRSMVESDYAEGRRGKRTRLLPAKAKRVLALDIVPDRSGVFEA